jgi:hypothetical protein
LGAKKQSLPIFGYIPSTGKINAISSLVLFIYLGLTASLKRKSILQPNSNLLLFIIHFNMLQQYPAFRPVLIKEERVK